MNTYYTDSVARLVMASATKRYSPSRRVVVGTASHLNFLPVEIDGVPSGAVRRRVAMGWHGGGQDYFLALPSGEKLEATTLKVLLQRVDDVLALSDDHQTMTAAMRK